MRMGMGKIVGVLVLLFLFIWRVEASYNIRGYETPHSDHPLSEIAMEKASFALDMSAYISASPTLLGLQGETYQWVTVKYSRTSPAAPDWIAVFSPANFNASTCTPESGPNKDQTPLLCSAPIKPKLLAISNTLRFANPKAPLYPRLAQAKLWNEDKAMEGDFSSVM